MSKRILGNWIKSYMEYSSHSEAPDVFHFFTATSVIAGALRRQVWIDQGYFQWTPNFYIILVAPPGIVSKSTTANIGMRLLKQIDGIHFGPDVVTWQALVQSMANSTEMVLMPDNQYHTMSCITIASSEFGTFLNPNDREMVDVLTSLWDGQLGPWEKATKTQGCDTIHNPWINIIACTTPAWIQGNMPDYVIGGGFMSRCIVVFADTKRKLVAYPADELPVTFREDEKKLVHDLELISMIRGEYSISAEAKAWGRQWYTKHYAIMTQDVSNDQVQSYMSRKQTHIHKLAMVLAASARDERVLIPKDLEEADAIITSIEGSMKHVFNAISSTDDTARASTLVDTVRRYKQITQNNLYRLMFERMSFVDYKAALESGVAAGYIKIVNKDGAIYVIATELKQ